MTALAETVISVDAAGISLTEHASVVRLDAVLVKPKSPQLSDWFKRLMLWIGKEAAGAVVRELATEVAKEIGRWILGLYCKVTRKVRTVSSLLRQSAPATSSSSR